jgi:hypothetical protein
MNDRPRQNPAYRPTLLILENGLSGASRTGDFTPLALGDLQVSVRSCQYSAVTVSQSAFFYNFLL